MKNFNPYKIAQIVSVILGFALVLSPMLAFAQLGSLNCGGFGVPCNVGNNTLTGLIIRVIQIILALAGLVAVLVLIIGGFRYVTSFGNEEVTGAAKKMILNALLGIVIIILAFVIVQVVINVTNRATQGSSL